jgi:hypothetical protein
VTNCVARDPKAALGRVRNRAIAALLRYVPFAEDEALSPLWLPRFVYALPLCAFLLAVGWPGPNRRLLRDLGLLIGCALLPYILVSFYARYAMPLTVVCPLVVFFGFDRMAFWSFRRSWTLRLREV